mmetsp:Transcript_28069/g.67066  ORF Transcript_28069/g.67066 Transcript_28069/m.67066 type:complete len:249 (-) Transcript_28069:252-998(-)
MRVAPFWLIFMESRCISSSMEMREERPIVGVLVVVSSGADPHVSLPNAPHVSAARVISCPPTTFISADAVCTGVLVPLRVMAPDVPIADSLLMSTTRNSMPPMAPRRRTTKIPRPTAMRLSILARSFSRFRDSTPIITSSASMTPSPEPSNCCSFFLRCSGNESIVIPPDSMAPFIFFMIRKASTISEGPRVLSPSPSIASSSRWTSSGNTEKGMPPPLSFFMIRNASKISEGPRVLSPSSSIASSSR